MKKTIYTKLKFTWVMLFFASFLTISAQSTVSGTVVDTDNEPVIGANVSVVGTTMGTVTDLDGKYSISASEGDVLKYSFLGYMTKTMTVTGGNQTIDITLGQDALALDEVIVTGTFTGRTQRDAPMSLTVLSSDKLSLLAANSQADVLRTVPGITAEGGGGEVASNVFVRGLPSGGQYQYTPLQIDGMPILSTFGLNSSAHDVYFRNDIGLRSLEFVRGGSATLMGAGSVAGVINYTSIRGSATPMNKVQLEWAEGGRLRTDFLTSGPLAENLFYAVSGFYRYDEGPLETGMPTRGYQMRGNIKKLFNDGKSSLVISGQKIDDNVQFYLPYPLVGDTRERPIGNDGEEVFTLLSGQLKDFSFDTPFGRYKSPVGDGVTTDGYFVMAELNHAFANDWILSSKVKSASYAHNFNLFLDGDGARNTVEDQASFLSNRGFAPTGATFTYVDTGEEMAASDALFQNRILDRQRDMEEVVAEINLTKSVDNHNITIGTFAANTKALDINYISQVLGDFRNAPRAVSVSAMDTLGNQVQYSNGGFISGNQTSNNVIESSKIAVYLADEYKGENFDFDIGVRWERASGIISKESGIGTNNFNKGSVSASDVAIALAALYRLNDKVNLYANASRGYFFPQLRSVQFANPGQPQSYAAERIIQGEVGLKYTGGNLAATGALFYNTLSDRRNVDFENDPSAPGGIREKVSTQSTRAIGLEASLNYAVSSGFNVYGNVTLQNHEFTSVESNPDIEGKKPRRIPNVMGLVGIDFNSSGFDGNLSSNFLGSKFANDINTVELDGFNIVRLDLGYTLGLGEGDEKVRLGLAVFNLLDSAGVTEGSPRQGNSQVGGGDFFVGRPILPRRIFLRLGFTF